MHFFTSLQIDNSFGQIKPFTFNAAFGEETSQEEMFEGCGIKHLVQMAVEGLVSEEFYIKICRSTLLPWVSSMTLFFYHYERHKSEDSSMKQD